MHPVIHFFEKMPFSRLRRALLVCVAVACAAGGWGRTFRWAGATSIDSPGDWNTYNGWEVANSSNDTITGWVSTSNLSAGIGKYHAFPDNDDSNTDTVYIDTSSGDVYLAITKNTEVSKLYVEGSGTVHFIVKVDSTFTIVDTFTIGHNSGYNSSASDDTYNDGAEIKTASSVQIEISGGGILKANTTAYVNTATDSVISITDSSTFSTGSLNASSGTIEVTGDGTGTFESTYTPPTVIIAADNLASYPTDSDATIRQSVTTYYWKGETTGGDWQNSDNWAPNPDGTGAVTAGTYPGFADGDTAVFSAEKVPSDSGFYLTNVSVASDGAATLTIRNDSEHRIWITEFTHKQETLIVQGHVRMACAEAATIGSVVVEKNSASAKNTFAVGCTLTIAGTLTIDADTTVWFLNPTEVTGDTENNGSIIGIRKDNAGTDQPVTFANLTNNGKITCEAGTLTINGDFVAGASSSFTASSENTLFYGDADFSAMTAANFVQPATGTIAVITEGKTLTTCAGQTFGTLQVGGTLTIDASNGDVTVTQLETQDAATTLTIADSTSHTITCSGVSLGADTAIVVNGGGVLVTPSLTDAASVRNDGMITASDTISGTTLTGSGVYQMTSLSADTMTLTGTAQFTGTGGTLTANTGATIQNLTVDSGADLTLASDVTITGTLNNDGTWSAGGNTITFSTAGVRIAAASGATTTFSTVVIASGALLGTDSSFTVEGNWTNDGAFAASDGTVTFGGTNVTVSGNNTFSTAKYTGTNATVAISGENTFGTLLFAGAGTTVRFGAGKTQTVTTALESQGTAGAKITLTTDALTPSEIEDDTWWFLDIPQSVGQAIVASDFAHTVVQYSSSKYDIAHDWGGTVSEGDKHGSTTNWFSFTFYWFGKSNADWATAENWSLSATYTAAESAPSATSGGDDIIIMAAADNVLDLTRDISVKSITNNGTLRMTGTQTITGSMANGADSTVEYYGSGITSLPWDGDPALNGKQYVNLVFADGAAGTESDVLNVSGDMTIQNGEGNALVLSGANTYDGALAITGAGDVELNSASGFSLLTDVDCTSLGIMSAVTFADGITVTAPAGIRARLVTDGTWQSEGSTLDFSDIDFFLDAERPSATLTLAQDMTCKNLYAYNGTLSAEHVTAQGDIALWGSGFSPVDPRYSADNTRFAYYAAKLSYYPQGGTAIVAGTTSAKIGTVAGTMSAGGNFYANGADLANVTLVLPGHQADSAPVFNATPAVTEKQWGIPYAVAFNLVATNVTVQCSDDSDPENKAWMTAATLMQNVTDGGGNSDTWQFKTPAIKRARTVSDAVVEITFDVALENSHDEVTLAATQTGVLLDGSVCYHDGGAAFGGGVFADAACTEPLATGDVPAETPLYFKARATWNTDADGSTAGDAQSTDRSGVHRAAKVNLSWLEGVFTAADGHTMSRNYGIGRDGGADASPYDDVTDTCAPVLVAARTGQEMHVAYDGAAESQPYYDAHNFIEFQYSEAVFVGDLSASADDENVQAEQNISASAHGGHITNNTEGFTVTGLATFARGRVVAGNKADASLSPHALYRTFATTVPGTAGAQTHRIRLSVAGYVDGTVTAPAGAALAVTETYRNWVGYIDAATMPSGTVTPIATEYVTDAKGNAIDATHTVTVDSTESGLYGTWDVTPPSFARYVDGVNDDFQWSGTEDARTTYEIIGTVASDVYLQNVEFHLFDNRPAYNASESYQWLARYGWMQGSSVVSGGETPDSVGGSRDFPPTATNHTAGGIRRASLAGAAAAFTYRYHLDGRDSDDRAFAESDVLQSVRSTLFRSEDQLSTETKNDGLYFSLFLNAADTALPIRTRFVITYDASQSYITDLAGNRLLQTDANSPIKTLNSIDVTPPSFALTLSPIGNNKVYVVFTKQLADEHGRALEVGKTVTDIAGEFEFVKSADGADAADTAVLSVTDAKVVKATADFTALLLTLTQNISLDDVEHLWLRVKKTEGRTVVNNISGSSEYPTLIRDNIGNYMEYHTCHALSDFALNAVNVLYAYTPSLYDENGEPIEKNLYTYSEEGDYAVHDFSAGAGNYGRLHAGEDITLQVQFVGGKDDNGFFTPVNGETMRLVPDLASHIHPSWKSDSINDRLGEQWRVWLTAPFEFIATGVNPTTKYLKPDPDEPRDEKGLLWNFIFKKDDDALPLSAGDEVQFLFELHDENGRIEIDHDADGGAETPKIPLYALWMPEERMHAGDFSFVDLWSFRLSDTKKQRGGVSILNNVINVSVKEQTVIQVDMPEDGNLNVYVMTLEGNIVQRLEHGHVSAGTHFYRWNGTNRAGNSVARGMYFVRVVGSGIDETRKVLCVKN